ncbi:type II secretion system protein [Paracoccus sp. ME4]|uniref:type II secretion system protein n=1 Tax=Paracoccus sp. ME4 TaxID=3138066 RepID=UPI00398B4A6F
MREVQPAGVDWMARPLISIAPGTRGKRKLAMKNMKSLRKRGFTLVEITLVLIIGLGLIVGGLVYFSQAQNGSDVTDRTRAIVSISSEVRSQYRMSADFDDVTTAAEEDSSGGAAATLAESVFAVRSGLPASTFNDVGLTGGDQAFTVTMANLTDSVCERLAVADLGPKKQSAGCTAGVLTVVYNR